MQILLYKRDLRTTDHEPLRQALACAQAKGSKVLALYVHEPSLLRRSDVSRQHTAFLTECLDELREELQILGGDLLERVGETVEVLQALWQQKPFTDVWAHQESTTEEAFARDRAVAAWCRAHSVALHELEHSGVRRGKAFASKGFSFGEHVRQALSDELYEPAPSPLWQTAWPQGWTHSRQGAPTGFGVDKPGRLRGGKSQALLQLRRFLQLENLQAYPGSISNPLRAPEVCSRLSPYLALGVLSDRQVLQALNLAVQEHQSQLGRAQAEQLDECARFFVERLYWRSSYLQAFERRPSSELVVDKDVFQGLREEQPWSQALEAWKVGHTGYPYIDAAMRQLAHTGWLNMRLRGTVTSFALNELWLPWREVGEHLAREFLDYEPGIHWNQIQIHAGSSRLSEPLTYNALKQAREHDPLGEFVRKWVPELRQVPLHHLHTPWKMSAVEQRSTQCVLGEHYPSPLVPLEAAHQAARERVAALRAEQRAPMAVWWKKRHELASGDKQGTLF